MRKQQRQKELIAARSMMFAPRKNPYKKLSIKAGIKSTSQESSVSSYKENTSLRKDDFGQNHFN